ncbi:MAG: lysylphosphatidylglycerol synthase transmembrane domain-containing protein [Candidatus Buchananbacteria bacterium]|jgi:uncharacterized protein (TIRG00374 family)
MKKNKTYSILLRLIGFSVFAYILFSIDFQLLAERILGINIIYLIIGFILTLGVAVAKALRWHSILNSLGIMISKFLSIKLYWLGLYVGIITPGKIGEVIKVYFLKAKGFSSAKSLLSIIIDRFLDMLVIAVLGGVVTLFYLRFMALQIIILSLAIILFFGLAYYLFNNKSRLSKWLDDFLKENINDKFYGYFASFFGACSELRNIKLGYIAVSFIYLVISWMLYYGANYMIALSLHLDISPMLLLAAIIAAIISSLLPISIAGIGTRDVSIIYVFSSAGISRETAIIFSFFVLVIDLLAVSFGLIPYLRESSLIARAKEADIEVI